MIIVEKCNFSFSDPWLYDDLCERLIYAAATLYNLKLKFEPSGDKELFLMMNSAMQAVTKQKKMEDLTNMLNNQYEDFQFPGKIWQTI